MFVKFAELPVFNQDRAVSFYSENLGCTVARDTPYAKDGWRWVELKLPGERTQLLLTRRGDDEPSDKPVLVLVEDDVKALFKRLTAKKVKIITAPKDASWEPGVVFAEFRDSEGNRIVVSSS
ncbi:MULTISPECIES: VOC family protein [Chelativorans]|jgi:predicted enzyme related to lactoylglutathione lyase|uniref:Glyoxalase/bleomycin resistance protein/dioxygenase n=1 Tax=Chelativorans sp. (strain BNC1) TaxID=266779 RepID=Q11GM6_CHESB|nr:MULTISPECIES: VOC family protein [Chelativorans]